MRDIKIPAEILSIIDILSGYGYGAYVVGGAVRDMRLGKTPHDWDVCTSATPDEIKKCFKEYRIIDTGLKHGTVTILMNDGQYEVTTFRIDGVYSDGRHPDQVSFTTNINSDLARRDFTINAMAWSPASGFVDPFGGLNDLKSKIIRCVGNPDERFSEDGLRILRAVRFMSTLGFSIEENTGDSIIKNCDLLEYISAERIASELNKTLLGPGVRLALTAYWKVISIPIPEINAAIGFDQKNPHHGYSLWGHTVEAIANSEMSLIIRLSMLLHDLSKPQCTSFDEQGIGHFYGHPKLSSEMADGILHRLKYDKETIEAVTQLIQYHDNHILSTSPAIKRWLNRLGESRFRELLAVERADALAHKDPRERIAELDSAEQMLAAVLSEVPSFTIKDLKINGSDVISLGVPEGKGVGFVLRTLLDMVIDEKIQNEEIVLKQTVSQIMNQTNIC